MKYVLLTVALVAGVSEQSMGSKPNNHNGVYDVHDLLAVNSKPVSIPDSDSESDSMPEGDRECAKVEERCPKDKHPWISVCGYWPKEGKFFTFVSKCRMDAWNACFLTGFTSLGELECNAVSYKDRYRVWEYDMQGNKLSDEEQRKFQDLMNNRKPRGSLRDVVENRRKEKKKNQ